MSRQIVDHAVARFPGNKRRTRRAELVFTNRDGSREVATPAERAGFFTVAPSWLVIEGFADDSAFLSGLERVLEGEETADCLAARYQRQRSQGHAVVLHLIEKATQYTISLLTLKTIADPRITLRSGVVCAMPSVGYVPDGLPSPNHRVRWGSMTWREDALGVLLARGSGTCLATGCDEPADRFGYCTGHSEMARNPEGVPQANPALALAVHDSRTENVRELMRELSAALRLADVN